MVKDILPFGTRINTETTGFLLKESVESVKSVYNFFNTQLPEHLDNDKFSRIESNISVDSANADIREDSWSKICLTLLAQCNLHCQNGRGWQRDHEGRAGRVDGVGARGQRLGRVAIP